MFRQEDEDMTDCSHSSEDKTPIGLRRVRLLVPRVISVGADRCCGGSSDEFSNFHSSQSSTVGSCSPSSSSSSSSSSSWSLHDGQLIRSKSCAAFGMIDKGRVLFAEDAEGTLEADLSKSRMVRSNSNNLCGSQVVEVFCVARLARGAFGSVFLGKQILDSHDQGHEKDKAKNTRYRYVALKEMHKEAVRTREQGVEQACSECHILQSCRHPFIAELYFAYQTETRLLLGMEYSCGGDLFSLLEASGSLEKKYAKFYLAEVGCALAYLHTKHIVYRDLKPENVSIAGDGHIRLIDFGLCAVLPANSKYGRYLIKTSSGTLEYSAPEILERQPHGTETDWWAFGVLAFEMHFGYPPFLKSNKQTTADAICTEPPKYPSNLSQVPGDIVDLIQGCLTKSQSLRLNFEQIKRQKYFEGIDWSLADQRGLAPPFLPDVEGPEDTSYFPESCDPTQDEQAFASSIFSETSQPAAELDPQSPAVTPRQRTGIVNTASSFPGYTPCVLY